MNIIQPALLCAVCYCGLAVLHWGSAASPVYLLLATAAIWSNCLRRQAR